MATAGSPIISTKEGFLDPITGRWNKTVNKKHVTIISRSQSTGNADQEESIKTYPQNDKELQQIIKAGARMTDNGNYILVVEDEAYQFLLTHGCTVLPN